MASSASRSSSPVSTATDRLREIMAAGRGGQSLAMGYGANSDRYIAASDATRSSEGLPVQRWGNRGSGFDESDQARTPREQQLRKDIANPLYQDMAKQMGIKLDSANDMGQIFKAMDPLTKGQASGQLAGGFDDPRYKQIASAIGINYNSDNDRRQIEEAATRAGIKNIDSDNDVRQVKDYLARSSQGSSSGGSMARQSNTVNRFDDPNFDSQAYSDHAGSLWNEAVLAKQRALRAQNEEVSPAKDGQPAVMGLRAQYGGYTYDPDGNRAGTFNGATNAAIDFGYQQGRADRAMANYFDKSAKAQVAEASGVMHSAIKRVAGTPPDAMDGEKIYDLYARYRDDIKNA